MGREFIGDAKNYISFMSALINLIHNKEFSEKFKSDLISIIELSERNFAKKDINEFIKSNNPINLEAFNKEVKLNKLNNLHEVVQCKKEMLLKSSNKQNHERCYSL